ncbi:MAG: cell division protein ZapA [Bacteroidota bacterium]
MDGKSIKVKIFGSEYPLRGENEDLTKKIAAHVDGMLTDIHGRIPEQPPLTVAVLAALNISEELLKEREEQKQASRELETELTKLSNYLDNCLDTGTTDRES